MTAARIRRPRHRGFEGLRRGRLDHTKSDIANAGLDGRTIAAIYVATFQNAANEVTLATVDDLPAGAQVVFYNTGGALPAALEEGLDYFLAEAGVNQYTLHASRADAANGAGGVALADDGTGTTTAYLIG